MPLHVTTEPTGLLRVVIDHGPGNLVDLPLARDLASVVDRFEGARCVLVTATGPHFCLGGNLDDFAAADPRRAFVHELADTVHVFVSAMATSGVPTVLAVQGWALGIGLSLALAADVVVASQTAAFRTGYPSLGLTPDGGMSWTLPRRVGAAVANDLLLTGRTLEAGEARERGIVSRVAPDDELEAVTEEVVERIVRGPVHAYAATKALMVDAGARSLRDHLDVEAAAIADACVGAEGAEGIRAFVEKRPPDFTRATRR